MRFAGLATSIAALLVASAGCGMLRGPEAQINFGAERYSSVAVLYRVESRPTAAAQPSTFSLTAATPSSAGVIQSLAIKYPHPSGRAGYARVELVVEKLTPTDTAKPADQPGWFSNVARMARDNMPGIAFEGNVIAAWGLDIPVNQIDPIAVKLQSVGFFSSADSSAREVHLGAKINGVGGEKPWTHVAELDALMNRVRKDGSFVSHRGISAESFAQTATAPTAFPASAMPAPPPVAPQLSPAASPAISVATRPGILPTASPALPPGWNPPTTLAGVPVLEPLPKVEPVR